MSIPIYLSGAPKAALWEERPDLFGALITPQMGNRIPDGVIWAGDNGCFNPRVAAKFKTADYLAWVAKHRPESCLFINARDVVGDARATLELALPMLPQIRALGFRAGFVAQEGIEELEVPWSEFDCLFVGGKATAWKLGPIAKRLCCEAKARGKWVHVGRVNSEMRVTYCAEELEADSCDGTFIAFAPDTNMRRLKGWYGCPDCRQLVRPDEFGLHPGCPALREFGDTWNTGVDTWDVGSDLGESSKIAQRGSKRESGASLGESSPQLELFEVA